MSRSNHRWFALIGVVAALIVLDCSKKSTNDDGEADQTPPVAITDLAVIASTSHSATLQWTAPHDYRDDNSNGMVDGYDVRVSYDSITAQNFAVAYSLDSVPGPAPAGLVQQCVLDALEPDSTYYFAIKSRDDKGNWSGTSNCCHAHCPGIQKVVFADTALERIVREHIHKPTGDILSSDVDTITYFGAYVAGIKSLAGMEFCTSLLAASFWENEITDLSPLANARQLWGLNVATNNITDLSPLAGHQYLRQLQIAENPITDISPLASMPSLQQLFMHSTYVTDFSPLYGLQHLDDIHLATLSLSDIGFMSNLTHLRICKLNSNNITSLTPLSNLTSMEGLDLMMNQISDLGPLVGLVNLYSLNLVYNSISDIQALVNNTGLGTGDVVHLGGNPLSQKAIDVQIPALQARGVTVTW